jgi:hypothetical protein
MTNLIFSTALINVIIRNLSFKPLDERIIILKEIIGERYLYSYEFLNICLYESNNDDLVEHIYIKSYKNENVLIKDLSYINTEKYLFHTDIHTEERNNINDNLWFLYNTAIKLNKAFLINLIINDNRFLIDDEKYHYYIFEYVSEKKHINFDIIKPLFLSPRLSKVSKIRYIERVLSKSDEFEIFKTILNDKSVFNSSVLTINKKTINNFVNTAIFFNNIKALLYLINDEKIFKLININKTLRSIYNSNSNVAFECFVDKNLINVKEDYVSIALKTILKKSYKIFKSLLIYDCVNGDVIFDTLKSVIDNNNVDDILNVFAKSKKINIYRDENYLLNNFSKKLNNNTIFIILQNTVLKIDDKIRDIFRNKIFHTDPLQLDLVQAYINNDGINDTNYIAYEAITLNKTDIFDMLLYKYPNYKIPEDTFYIQQLSTKGQYIIHYCLEREIFNIAKYTHYIISKLLESHSLYIVLLILEHQQSKILDETIQQINKFITSNSKLYDDTFLKDIKISIRKKKIANIIMD